MPLCAVCGKEVNFKNVAYISGSIFVCKDCFPQYYVKNVCKLVERRLKGENPLACNFCTYKKQCDVYISKTLKSLS
jgi:ribosome-binding protein aMBF1 (putative translation factor)